jgi:hypothetical protein
VYGSDRIEEVESCGCGKEVYMVVGTIEEGAIDGGRSMANGVAEEAWQLV